MALIRIVDAYCSNCGRPSNPLINLVPLPVIYDAERLRNLLHKNGSQCLMCGTNNSLILATEPAGE